jgi:parallel beta-helix repeat protein
VELIIYITGNRNNHLRLTWEEIMRKAIIFTAAFIAVIFMSASATIINVPDDQPAIQAGIDVSFHGDTVRVAPGTYVENIDFSGKYIVVGSWFLDDGDPSYITSTIIDGNQAGSVVTFVNGESSNATITGFTIQNGMATVGGGIYCESSSPTISDNTISGNSASAYGGGICCYISIATISNNTISGNSAVNGGGGIYCNYSNPTIIDNTISGNSADNTGGGIGCYISIPTISNNAISGNSSNSGGGIYCNYDSSPTISGNTISGNSAGMDGGGIRSSDNSNCTVINNTMSGNSAGVYGGSISCWNSSPVITNTIFWAGSAPYGPEIYLGGTSSPVITYCDIQGGWAGEGNIDCDPLFCDSLNGDYTIDRLSCCKGNGENGVNIGAHGVGCWTPMTINIPADFSTIQEGIDASFDGDTVRVAPGGYFENIDFSGKNIVVGSWFLDDGDASYISLTIIDGGAWGSVVSFSNGEDNAIVTGFTIQNGNSGYGAGGGIFCASSNPTISDNTISGNSASSGGAILCSNNSNCAIINNTISGNSAGLYGGGICCWNSSPVITNTIFWGDSAPTGSEIFLDGTSFPVITYCDVQGGWEGDGNIDCDPMFCDPENGNYFLDAASCCVGAGEGGVDIGAFGVGCGESIPTLSEWGMLVMGLLLLAISTAAVVRRKKAILSRAS